MKVLYEAASINLHLKQRLVELSEQLVVLQNAVQNKQSGPGEREKLDREASRAQGVRERDAV